MTKKNHLSNGFLLLYDWLPALESLSAEDMKAFLLALIARQRDNTPLPHFDNPLCNVFAGMIEPTLRRRLEGSAAHKDREEQTSGEEDYAEPSERDLPSEVPSEVPSKLPSEVPSEVPSKLPSEVPSEPAKQSKDKQSRAKQSRAEQDESALCSAESADSSLKAKAKEKEKETRSADTAAVSASPSSSPPNGADGPAPTGRRDRRWGEDLTPEEQVLADEARERAMRQYAALMRQYTGKKFP